jgi:hypothetical protein
VVRRARRRVPAHAATPRALLSGEHARHPRPPPTTTPPAPTISACPQTTAAAAIATAPEGPASRLRTQNRSHPGIHTPHPTRRHYRDDDGASRLDVHSRRDEVAAPQAQRRASTDDKNHQSHLMKLISKRNASRQYKRAGRARRVYGSSGVNPVVRFPIRGRRGQ